MRRAAALLFLLLMPVLIFQASAQEEGVVPGIIVEGTPSSVKPASVNAPEYFFRKISMTRYLNADGSAVNYIENKVENDSSTPLTSQTWCFYWGQDVYSNVFAEDDDGYLEVNYYENYSTVYDAWGLCVETPFRTAIGNGQVYTYSVSVTIANHHSVTNDTIDASWWVRSGSSVNEYVSKASWPFNHEGFTADPEPDEEGNSYAIWQLNPAAGEFEFTVHLTVNLGSTMAVTPLSQGTNPFNGDDITWEDDPYGLNTGQTIGDLGCYLTAGTMAMNYFASVASFTTPITPGGLNTWMRTPNNPGGPPRGYATHPTACGAGVYCLVGSYMFDDASEALFSANAPIIIPGELEAISAGVADMEDNLQNGELGLLNVSNGGIGHFVLVTGYTTAPNGTATVNINDPFESRGSTTLYAQYNNQHFGNVRWFSLNDDTVLPNYVMLIAQSPVELLVTDSLGRRAGYDPRTNTHYDEIPESSYVVQYQPYQSVDGEGIKILQIQAMNFETYSVEIIGTGTGAYTLQYIAELANSADTQSAISGTTKAGQVDTIELDYNPNEGFGLNRVFLPLIIK